MKMVKKFLHERTESLFLVLVAVVVLNVFAVGSQQAESKNVEPSNNKILASEEQTLGETDNNIEEVVSEETVVPSEEILEEPVKVAVADFEDDNYEDLEDHLKKYCGKKGSDNRKKCEEYCSEAKNNRKKSEEYKDLYEKYCTIETTFIIKDKKGHTIARYNHFRSSSLKEITVFELMKKASKEEKFSFKYENYSFGAFIYEIHGIGTKVYNGFYWKLSINGKSSNVGASDCEVSDGDVIEWEYTDKY